jgi:hypothetical protein
MRARSRKLLMLELWFVVARCAAADDPLPWWNHGPGKPVGINWFIGRRPILAFGNSDGGVHAPLPIA